MPNTYKNKVVYNGTTLIDLTNDTAIASDVAAGKYFHLSTGERVVGMASGGTILPTFAMTISSLGQVTSITCDMSYAQCAALLADDEPTANVAITLPDSSTQTWGACGYQNQGSLWYVVLEPSSMEPVAEIEYHLNGTIEATVPPTYIPSLSVTQNGTYSGLYKDVEVSVAGTDSTFVITVSYNSQTQMWEPDCTYAEVAAAHQAGKELVAAGPMEDMVTADCEWNADESVLYYMVYWLSSSIQWDCRVYALSSSGIDLAWDDSISEPTGTITIANSGNTNVAQYATASVPNAQYDLGIDTPEYYTQSNQRKWRFRTTYQGWNAGWMTAGTELGSYRNYNAVPANTTVTPSTSAQTIGGANYMMEGAVTVAAMPSGTAGTPTATKGSVSNHSVSVTPSVTNSTGYITGGTKTGAAVSVSASELVSGTLSITSSGTKDVTNYASASVASGGATASATKGSVSNHSVTVTPSVTRTAGYVTAGTASGTAVTVSASELVSGNKAIVENGTNIDVTDYATVSVNVSGGGSSSYTRTVVVPQQTVTPNSSRTAAFTSTEYFVDGEYYVVTCDGTEYIVTAETLWSGNVILGDAQVVWATSDVLYPFALITDGSAREGYFTTTSAHTIKVEHLEFVDGPLNLIAKSVTANGTYNASSDNADGYSSVTVNVSGGSSKNVQVAQSTTRVANTAYTKAASLTCSKAGTYDVYWDCFRSSTSGTSGSQLYIGGSAYGNPNTTFSSNIHAQNNHLTGVQISANQEVAVYVRSRATNYYAYCGQLTIVQTA